MIKGKEIIKGLAGYSLTPIATAFNDYTGHPVDFEFFTLQKNTRK